MQEKQMREKRTTIYQLAEELGVSIAAISRAFDPNSRLSSEKRTMILEAAERYGYRPNKMASRLSMRPIRIGVLNFSYVKAYYMEIMDGIRHAHETLKDYKVDCDLRILQRGEHSMEEALAVLEEFLDRKYDGVIICGIYEDCVIDYIDRMKKAGIPVATIQYDLKNSRRLFASVGNYEIIGKTAAQLCGMLLRGSACKDTVMFTGNRSSPTHRKLVDVFCAAAGDNGFRIVDIYDTMDDPLCCERLVDRAFSEHPQIAAIYASSANSLPICRHLEKSGNAGKVAFVASDVFEELYPYIEKGYIDATIYQEPFKMGDNAFSSLYWYLAEGTPVEDVLMSTPRVVLKSNLHCFK